LKSTTLKSRQRRRTEKAAIKFLDTSLKLPPVARRKAKAEICAAGSPKAAAKRIISSRIDIPAGKGRLDHSDVQEVICKLLRRDGIIDTPHVGLIRRLDIMVIDGCRRVEFDRLAKVILSLPHAMPKRELMAERGYAKAPPIENPEGRGKAYVPFLQLSGTWRLASNPLQWIVQRRGSFDSKRDKHRWTSLAYVATRRTTLMRVLREVDAEVDHNALDALDDLPQTFKEWKGARARSTTRGRFAGRRKPNLESDLSGCRDAA